MLNSYSILNKETEFRQLFNKEIQPKKLLSYLPENTIFYYSSRNLLQQINLYRSIFSAENDISKANFDGYLSQIKNAIFTQDLNFSTDLFPLMQDESLFIITQNNDQIEYSYLQSIPSKEILSERIDKIGKSLSENLSQKYGIAEEIELPDKSKGKIYKPSAIELSSTASGNFTYKKYTIGTKKILSIIYDDKKVLITTDTDFANSFLKNSEQQKSLDTLSQFDEYSLLDLTKIKLPPTLQILNLSLNTPKSISQSRSFFSDAISTKYTIKY